VVIDVQVGTLSLQLCEEMVDFYFSPLTPYLVPAIFPPPTIPMHTVLLDTISQIEVFDGDGIAHMGSIGSSDFSTPSPTNLGGISTRPR